jgi:hypothetical protein
MEYGIGFLDAPNPRYVIRLTSVEADSVKEAALLALPEMPHNAGCIVVTWYCHASDILRFRHAWFVFSNGGHLREIRVIRRRWFQFFDWLDHITDP